MTVRIGVIGCGAIATRAHAPLLLAAGAQLTAFASRSESSARSAAEQYGGAVCSDWRALLERDDVDAVTICTPNGVHAEQAIAALQSGKHVLVEKPFTVTVAEADAVLHAAAAADRFVMTSQSVRYAPQVVALKAGVEAIGEVTSVEASFCHAGPSAWAPDATWFFDPAAAGGGALLDLGVHLIDSLRWLLDDELVTVSAVLSGAPVEQDAVLSFTTARGAVGSLHAGWRSVAGMRIVLAVSGTQGRVTLDDRGPVLQLVGQEPAPLELPDSADSPQAAFVRALESGEWRSGFSGPTGADGRAAVAVVQAAYLSAAEGRAIEVAR